jgi:Zn-dependent protease with chaperone function
MIVTDARPREEACPGCGATIVIDGVYPPWCAGCDWGLRPPPPAAGQRRVDRVAARVARRLDDLAIERLVAAESLRPRPTPARVAALVVAIGVHLLTVALLVGAVALVATAAANPFADVLALVFAITAVTMRPRLGSIPREGVLSRADAPELHRLVDDVADELGARSADVVVVDAEFNASWSVSGLRRRRVLSLGLPLLIVLEPQQVVALIAHEVGHERNGDLRRGLLVDSTIGGLASLYLLLAPDSEEGRYEFGSLAGVASGLMRIIGLPVRLLLEAQVLLVLRDSQRAEYLADHLAARVAGTEAEVGATERILLAGAMDAALQRHVAEHGDDGAGAIAALRSAASEVPERERERRRRVARLEGVRLNATHPPTGRRIELLRRRPALQPAIRLDAARWQRIAGELAAVEARVARELVDGWRGSRMW